jgi:hypothetical protein
MNRSAGVRVFLARPWFTKGLVVFCVGLGLGAYTYGKYRTNASDLVSFTGTPTVERLERLKELVTLRVHIADVLTAEGSGYKGAWLIKGDALLCVDLNRARITDKDEPHKHLVVHLPKPHVLQPRVDHNRTLTWDVEKTSWIPFSGNQSALCNQAMKQAQQLVEHAASSDEYLQEARVPAEAAVKLYCKELGWEADVQWENAGRK